MGASSSTVSQIKGVNLSSSFDEILKDFKLESKIFSQETITLIQSHLEKGHIQSVASAISDALRDIYNAPLNIAVTGESGTGKSSFINALQGVKPDKDGTTHTGPVETTMDRTKYEHKKFPNVILWDLPGMGTTKFPPHKYLKKMKFWEHDFFIIISATCFKENDMHLVTVISKMKKNFYFVCSKVDSDLYNIKMSKPKECDKDKILQEIHDDCVNHLQKASMRDVQIFLVSSFDLSTYDFQSLEQTLLRDIPIHKCHIFMQYLPNVTEAAINRKMDSLKQKAWLETLKAGASATVPFMGLITDNELEKLEETLSLYRSYFGLDDASLENMTKDFNVSVEEPKANLISTQLLSVEKGDESLGEKLLRYVEKFCSVNEVLIASGLY